MRCRRVPSGHWTGVLTLLMGFCLSVAGVVSPWWRMVEGHQCSSFEGLWQQCVRCWHRRTHCSFSDRDKGLWRAVQGVHLMSLVCLTGGLLCAVTCADKRKCTRGKCPTPALAALVGGMTGLMANLMFVGYTERYVQQLPREHAYAWSFAMAVTGSLLALLAALIFSISKAICLPRYTSESAEPYWPYNHCRVGVDPNGYPQYFPYPCITYPGIPCSSSEELGLGLGSSALEKRKMFEQQRQGRLQVLTAEEKSATSSAGLSFSSSASTVKLATGYGNSEALKQKSTKEEGSKPEQAEVDPPAYHEIERGTKEGVSNTEPKAESGASQTQDKAKDEVSDRTLKEADQTSLPDQSRAPAPGSPVMVLTLEMTDKPPRGQVTKEGNPPIFVVEKAFQESRGTEGTKEDQERRSEEAGRQN